MSSELLTPITKELLEPLFERRDLAARLRERKLEDDVKRLLPLARRKLYDCIAKCISDHGKSLEFELEEGDFFHVRDRLLKALAAELRTEAPESAFYYPASPIRVEALVVYIERLRYFTAAEIILST